VSLFLYGPDATSQAAALEPLWRTFVEQVDTSSATSNATPS
jgi:hypothetical protein